MKSYIRTYFWIAVVALIILLINSQVNAHVVKVPFPTTSKEASSASVRPTDIDKWVEDHVASHPDPSGVDLVVVFTDNGKPITPDASRKSVSAASTNELSFTFVSPDYPFTQSELDILKPAISTFKTAITEIYGPPAFNITVNVRKNPNISFAGLYYSYYNEIVVPSISFNTLDVICHEMVHAYHDDWVIEYDTFEEGFARSVEVLVFSRIEGYTHSWNQDFSYSYDVWYEGENNPGIGGEYGSYFYGDTGLTLLRYQMGGYAWAKVFYENESFYKNFNLAYYSSDSHNEQSLKDIVRQVVPSVEGKPFDDWYESQHILNTNPHRGYQLTSRIGQYTFDYLFREDYGYEEAQPNVTVYADFLDNADSVFDAWQAVTSPKGWVNIYPIIPDGYTGRMKVIATAPSVESTFYRTALNPSGVFGVTKNASSGELVVTSPVSTVKATVTDGAFYIPALKDIEGRFMATFQPTSGPAVTRSFNKGASSYYLFINDDPVEPPPIDPVDPPPIVEPVEPPPVEPPIVEPVEPIIEEPIIEEPIEEKPIDTDDGNDPIRVPEIPVQSAVPAGGGSGGGGGCFIMSTF